MKRRGSTMLEPAMVTSLFLMLVIGIADFGRMGFAFNSIAFASHRAARWASTRGSASGHAALPGDIQANALANVAGLDTTQLKAVVTWTPANNNNPGSSVQVQVTYNFKTLLIPISSKALALKSTSAQIITQ